MLWKNANTQNKGSTGAPETRQAEALWRRIHERDEAAKIAHTATGNGTASEPLEHEKLEHELDELVGLSGSVHDSLSGAAIQATLEIDAHEAFSPTHARLMDDIAVSQTSAAKIGAAKIGSLMSAQQPIAKVAISRHEAVSRRTIWARQGILRRAVSRFSPRRALYSETALRWGVALLLAGVVGIGSHNLRRAGVTHELPVQSLVDDFDSDLRNPAPLEFVADDSQDERVMSRQLSRRMGVRVRVAATKKTGVRLLGARRHQVWNRPGVQSHYVKNGVQVALYQIREPRCSLSDLDEVEIGGRLYLTGARGAYHVVAWRSGDNVMTLVSPLKMNDALQLALTLRDPDASDASDASDERVS